MYSSVLHRWDSGVPTMKEWEKKRPSNSLFSEILNSYEIDKYRFHFPNLNFTFRRHSSKVGVNLERKQNSWKHIRALICIATYFFLKLDCARDSCIICISVIIIHILLKLNQAKINYFIAKILKFMTFYFYFTFSHIKLSAFYIRLS